MPYLIFVLLLFLFLLVLFLVSVFAAYDFDFSNFFGSLLFLFILEFF